MAYISFQPKDYFNTHLYSGNDTTNNQQVGLTPDLVWVKSRNTGSPTQHYWVDKVRGDKKYISSNSTASESTDSNTFDLVSGGFNLAGGNGWTNLTGRTYASWNWLANGAGSSNTEGDITATVSANTTSGFSIIKFTSAGSVSQSYGHGLNGTPKLWIIKDTSTSSNNWQVYYNGTDRLKLDTNEATSTTASQLMSANATTITTPSYADGAWGNGSGLNYITYAFQEIKGFSKIGKYTGNGNADGVYQHLGFSASWLMIKRTDSTASWVIFDNKRLGYNVANYQLYANSTSAEGNNVLLDITSQGFKCRANHLDVNGSGASYIFMAFAEAPLVSSNGVPAVAR
ncbi:hypothetical protein [uncultured Mediterranean phage uvMED]|uniref:DUF7483 domain-containing protein n=1 Tax=uncultured organism MedDCM-OCT-S11-C359 TaxID=743661 RepID=D6PLH8_9ZZZZ|nr:hypothetical protein [uncultured organism MedDCM-OCT-S11-C359]BAQ88756.1 hypothetical protein [uncultured Mediterranean phage uvMED]BAR18595.1 hypothetical protein [uncultured Mediterranean phage uvMED]BAR18657.1 hypothetical protein [uncultured Mediterranean phage uvMED]BAR18715.1 hypothetical protein [uncultured Mediterranean phage uvMED]